MNQKSKYDINNKFCLKKSVKIIFNLSKYLNKGNFLIYIKKGD